MFSKHFLIFLYIFLINFLNKISVYSFNLENRLPIIKLGEKDSYFGYSVAEHVIGGKNESNNTKWLLVGAPLGTNLQPNVSRSGALYKCPITQNRDDCTQVITDGIRGPHGVSEYSIDDPVLIPPNFDEESKEGQWLGVTVKSQGVGGKVFICAHRYILKSSDSQKGQGLCYVLDNALEYDTTYEPCRGRTVQRFHEDYLYCQVGTSGALLPDGTMILGTPGPYTWRGLIYIIKIDGEYLKMDKTQYYSPHTESTSPVDKYSYLGMSVTGGKYFGSNVSYAAGAPRALDHGQVVIFSKLIYQQTPINITLILDGEQFASSFGYEIATVDINGDGMDDLIVAAPFYFTRHEGGAVYVYQNVDFSLPDTATLKLTGKPESRFGLALANIGDINKDGCEDLAIGAPYENNGAVYIYLGSKDGLSKTPSQVIRVSDLGLNPPVITTFGSSISGGTDLDSNNYPDLLIGAYNSDTVVALLARPITNIKTEVQSIELKNIDPKKQGCDSDLGTNLTCFSFRACCAIEPYEENPQTNLSLRYTIEAETFNNLKKFSRVFFGREAKKRNHIIEKNIQVLTNGISYCQEEVVYIKENTRDIQTPIKFRLNYTLIEPPLSTSGLIVLHPILDQIQSDRPFEATFQKNCLNEVCVSQLMVTATLDLDINNDNDEYTLKLGYNSDIRLTVEIVNDKESAYEALLIVEHQPSVSYIAAIKGSVICNRFNKTIVTCSLGNPMPRDEIIVVTLRFDPSGLEDSEPKLAFKLFANSTSEQEIPQNDTILHVTVVKEAQLSVKGRAKPEQSFYGGVEKAPKDVLYLDELGTFVEHSYQIYNDGPWRAPVIYIDIEWPLMYNDEKSGSDKQLIYLNEDPIIESLAQGQCLLKVGQINPQNYKYRPILTEAVAELKEDDSSKLNIRKSSNKSFNEVSESSEKLSYSKYSSSSSSVNRVRREALDLLRPENLTAARKFDTVQLDCDQPHVKCLTLSCRIYNLHAKSEAQIHIKGTLINSTLMTHYPKVDSVRIISRAKISIPDEFGKQSKLISDRTSVETHAYPELTDQAVDQSVPIWIYIVAALGGILLLALLTLLLWKLGFFKRRRPDPTLSGNLEKNSENKPFISK